MVPQGRKEVKTALLNLMGGKETARPRRKWGSSGSTQLETVV